MWRRELAVDNCPVSRVALMMYARHHSYMLRQLLLLLLLLLLTIYCGSPSVCMPDGSLPGNWGRRVSTSLECMESFVTDQWSVNVECLT